MSNSRIVPAAEEIIDHYFPVLDHGFVALKDYMGSDLAIEQAARASYGKGTRSRSDTRHLLRYLMRHGHASPFEMASVRLHIGLPIVVMRQLVRQRTACLSANTTLHFDLPSGIRQRGNRLTKLAVGEVYERFHSLPYKQKQILDMHIRSVDENTLAVRHTKIVDIWQSGVKPVYKVTLENGNEATMSQDHRCLTENGWFRLKDLVEKLPPPGERLESYGSCRIVTIGPGRDTGVVPCFNVIDEGTEDWLPIPGWEDWYQVSNQGRVRRIVGGKGSRSFGRCKKLTVSNNHAVVSLNRPGHQQVRLVHALVVEAFIGPGLDEQIVRHKDGNGLNNYVGNLEWSTHAENHEDRVRDGATTSLRANLVEIACIEHVGEEMTYDLEVEGPWHNFSAGGMIVHNSLNEYSGRYSEMPLLFYKPEDERIKQQSQTNKQGSGPDSLSPEEIQEYFDGAGEVEKVAVRHYRRALANNVAREVARNHLPLTTYTYLYWKIDMRNMFNLLHKRLDLAAQPEYRAYARVLAGIAQRLCPLAFEAFQDYQENSVHFSQAELAAMPAYFSAQCYVREPSERTRQYINEILHANGISLTKSGRESREQTEFWDKLKPKTPQSYELDLTTAKSPAYYEKLVQENL